MSQILQTLLESAIYPPMNRRTRIPVSEEAKEVFAEIGGEALAGSGFEEETPAPEFDTALSLLREVHENNLRGYLYSGPLRSRVAKFLGAPDLISGGDGLAITVSDWSGSPRL